MNLKIARKEKGLTQQQVADFIGISQNNYSYWERGLVKIDNLSLQKLAKLFSCSTDYLLGGSNKTDLPANAFPDNIIKMPVIGSVKAGYDGMANEEYTDDEESIPASELKGLPADNFFVLRISGDSMYPLLMEGDRVLVQRMESVDSGSIAVVLYDGDDATVKRVQYTPGCNYLNLIPVNTNYPPKRIEGADLEQCRVLGKVVKLFREVF